MKNYQKELARIREILTSNPRGMTIADISKEMNINRNSVAKYLDVLLALGYVEMKALGPAKVFYLSRRVPISALLNLSSDCILVLNEDLKITLVNDNLLSLMNTKREAMLGRGIESSFYLFFSNQEALSPIKEALDGKASTIELKLQANEVQFYFNVKVIPTTFDDGGKGVALCIEDITAKEKAGEELRKLREEYIATTNLTSDIILRVDEEGRLTLLNDGACKFWGKPREDLLDSKLVDYLHPADDEQTTAAIQDMIKTKQMVRSLKNRYRTPKGWRIVEWNGTPILDGAGNYAGLQVIGRDTTEREKTYEKLRQSEAKIHALLNLISDLMFEISKDGTILDFKAAKEFPILLPSGEFVGKKVHEVMPTKFAQEFMHYIKQTLQTGDIQIFEYQLPVPLQSLNFFNYKARIVAINENKVLVIMRALNKHKRIDAYLRYYSGPRVSSLEE